jgi:hypothetical protein
LAVGSQMLCPRPGQFGHILPLELHQRPSHIDELYRAIKFSNLLMSFKWITWSCWGPLDAAVTGLKESFNVVSAFFTYIWTRTEKSLPNSKLNGCPRGATCFGMKNCKLESASL